LTLPIGNRTWDIVISLETIEHLHDRGVFVGEVRGIRAPDQLSVMSAPNARYTPAIDGKPRSAHHAHGLRGRRVCAGARPPVGSRRVVRAITRPLLVMFPFHDDHCRLPRTFRSQARLLWPVLCRTFATVRDHLSRAIWGHSLTATVRDREVEAEGADQTFVLIGGCPA
jgi:hypothetical protein